MNLLTRYELLREGQREMAQDVYTAISNEKNIMVHAPTGIGKTDASLSAALTAASESGCDVFFITPKNSQHKIANDVVMGICKKMIKINSTELVGKKHMCNIKKVEELPFEDFYHMCRLRIKNGTCKYYEKAKNKKNINLNERFNLTHNELCRIGNETGVCAYELALNAISKSQVVIGDYSHVLMPAIAYPLMKKTGKMLKNSIVIVDEAHNLSVRLREHLSTRISERTLMRARKECQYFDSDALSFIEEEFAEWCKHILGHKDEKIIEIEDLIKLIQMEMRVEDIVNSLYEIGNEWVEKMNKTSACLRIADFISMWIDETDDEKFVRIAKKVKDTYVIEKICLSPEVVTSKLNETVSTVLMSGTLKPFEMHRDTIGLNPTKTEFKEYESPFPRENCLWMLDNTVTTRYTKRGKDEYKLIGRKISDLCVITPGNTAVFFPSYEVMKGVLPYVDPGKMEILVQTQDMDIDKLRDMITKVCAEDGYILFGVQGGSLSEGVDYENNALKCVIIVGIPFEEMNLEVRARIEYYGKVFGKGWEYGYAGPAITKSLQAAGRAIRSSNDKAVIVLMDERFGWKGYRENFGDMEKLNIKKIYEFWKLHQTDDLHLS